MAHKIPKNGRMIRRTRSGGSVAIEFVDEHGERVIGSCMRVLGSVAIEFDDEHGERVIGEYMWVGWSAEYAPGPKR